jgi:uncharacterized Zn finger protein
VFTQDYDICPICTADLSKVIKDVLRKTDRSLFECPGCSTPLVATLVRTVAITVDLNY